MTALGFARGSAARRLPPALGAPCVNFDVGGVHVAMYLCGDAAGGTRAPLLLVHGVSIGASAMQMRPLFEHFSHPDGAAPRPVAALELPGFGASQRDVADASPALMTAAILAALHHLQERGLRAPADVCALGLSCEFATCAALRAPERFRSLALISPSGMQGRERCTGGRTRMNAVLRRALAFAPLGQAFFRSMATRASLRQQFETLWDSPLVDEALLDYSHHCTKLAGARHVPLALLCGALSTRGVSALYRQLALPVWVGHGMRGIFSNFDPLTRLGPALAWTRQAYDTGAMPHFEHAELFCAHYGAFLHGLD